MRKVMYSTILLFVGIMIVVSVVALRHPVVIVEYKNSVVVEQSR